MPWPSPATSTTRRRASAAIDEAAAGLGGIDALVYAPGVGTLGRLVDLTAEDWRHTFDTNVIGAALVTNGRHSAPHRLDRRGRLPVLGRRLR